MTLSQADLKQDLAQGMPKEDVPLAAYSETESDLLEKAAVAGLPSAQLAPAQLYLSRSHDTQDLVRGYMWYLVAMERASQALRFITIMMTPQQIKEAKHGASIWLSRLKLTSGPSLDPTMDPKPSSPAGEPTYRRTQRRSARS